MKTIIPFLFILFTFSVTAQKVKIKKGKVFIDKVEYVLTEEDKLSDDSFIISNLKGEELFYLKYKYYSDPNLRRDTNPNGTVVYFELMSKDLETIYFEAESHPSLSAMGMSKKTYKILYNGEVINKDGTINKDNLETVSKKIGFEFSKKRTELN
ncbi:hypothetical protein Q4512_03270 [Oceanihabitans sp. 2_MG-2023]|uniref:hypothetical protein n=1 Tax=Oceanihabitans sp. 2_MG-2023 TaxID=3062661 RepID=UPI0026E20452|nr:hypothetical protein [Oceanihabitans sp. 2_MG-2023]MDO6595919.1 hypothetical protein [Oceanihabitans sp. 2_MG-2023]